MSNPTLPAPSIAGPAAGVALDEDGAVEFLASIAPPSPAERTRAFAALLRALTSEAVLR